MIKPRKPRTRLFHGDRQDDPPDGTVAADGAVWGSEGGWHLVKVTELRDHGYTSQAVCSCGWGGLQRWVSSSGRLLADQQRSMAASDAELHTWSVSR